MKPLGRVWRKRILGTLGCLSVALVQLGGYGADGGGASGRGEVSLTTDALAREVQSTNEVSAAGAIMALGNIGSPAAAKILEQLRTTVAVNLRPQLTEARLACANHLAQQGDERTAEKIYVSLFHPAEIQAVRLAALRGIVQVQGEKSLRLLLTILGSETDPLGSIAADLLRRLPGSKTSRKIADGLIGLPPSSQILVLSALRDRGDPEALAGVLPFVRNPNAAVSTAALEAIGPLGDAAQIPLLVEYVAHPQRTRSEAAQTSLIRLHGTNVNARILECLSKADSETGPKLIECLARRQAAVAVPDLLHLAAAAESPVQFAALRALANWPDAQPLDELLKIATESPSFSSHLVALHGYVRLLGLPHTRTPGENLAKYQEAFVLARRVEEKNMILGSLVGIDSVDALHWVASLLADEALNAGAALATTKIAGAIGGSHRETAQAALQQVLKTCRDDTIRRQAEEVFAALVRWKD